MRGRWARATLVLVGLGLGYSALMALLAPRPPNMRFEQWVVVPVAVGLAAAATTVRVPAGVRAVLESRLTAPLVALLAGGSALAVGLAVRLTWSWDVGAVFRTARLMSEGERLTPASIDYFSRYPNTLPLLAVHRAGFAVADAVGGSAQVVLIVLVAVCVAVTVYLVHALVAPTGGRGRAVVAQLVVLLLVAFSPWMATAYTDTLGMPFVTGALVLAARALDRRDGWAAVQLLGCAALTAVAIVLKTNPVVLLVAYGLAGLLFAASHREEAKRVLAGTAATIALAVVATLGLTAAANNSLGAPLNPEQSMPALQWVASGMTQQTRADGTPSYGGYNTDLARLSAELGAGEADALARQWIRAAWEANGPLGMARFYLDKQAWNWGDGMFWAYGEGSDWEPDFAYRDGAARWVQTWNSPTGDRYELRASLAQGLWVAVLLVAAVGALLGARRRTVDATTVLLALGVLGIGAFILLSQGRSRYVFSYVPLVVALAAIVRPWLRARPPGEPAHPVTR